MADGDRQRVAEAECARRRAGLEELGHEKRPAERAIRREVEEEFAVRLKWKIGDRVAFDIAGQVRDLETTAVSIATAVDQQSVAGRDLAQSIDLAARGTEKVAGHIDDVRQLSLSTGAAASQVLSSANELEAQAAHLSDQVRGFLGQVRAG